MAETVSFFVHNLGSNPVGRAIPIARAFEHLGYQVEILGFVFGDGGIYEPYRHEIEAKTIHTTSETLELYPNVLRLARQAEGDLVYAFKPLVTTLVPAVYAARVDRRRPLLLDVEDEEVYTDRVVTLGDAWTKVLRGWRLGTSWKYSRLAQLLRPMVDGTTVVSTALQSRYGGVLLRHGPDESTFDPARSFGSKDELRTQWGLPQSRNLAMFIGTPRSHKGLGVIADALQTPQCNDWDFVLVGPNDNRFTRPLQQQLGTRYHHLGAQPYSRTPELLSIADAVPIPSRDVAFARAQVPAKLLDAMAMARPVVASKVGDLPDILGHGRRGWLVDPGDPDALARSLHMIGTSPQEVRRRSQAARTWYERNASTSALAEKLQSLIRAV